MDNSRNTKEHHKKLRKSINTHKETQGIYRNEKENYRRTIENIRSYMANRKEPLGKQSKTKT